MYFIGANWLAIKTLKRVQGDDILEELLNGFSFAETRVIDCVALSLIESISKVVLSTEATRRDLLK